MQNAKLQSKIEKWEELDPRQKTKGAWLPANDMRGPSHSLREDRALRV